MNKERQPCEIYVRIMGYHRSISQANLGKQCEHYNRTQFDEKKSMNSKFIQKYLTNT